MSSNSLDKFNAFEVSFAKMALLHFQKHIWKYLLAIFSLVCLHVIQVQIPKMIMSLSTELESEKTSFVIFKFILVALGIIVFRTISRWYFFYPARVQQKDLRDELLYKLSLCSPLVWKNYTTGKLYEILISDLEELRVFFGFALLQIVNLMVALVILLPAMINVSQELLWSLLPLGISFIVFSLSLIITTSLSEKGRNEHDILQQMLVEFYDAKKTLNVFCKEKSAIEEFTNQSKKELDFFLNVNLIRSITRPLILFGGGLSLIHAAYLVHIYQYPMSYLVVYSTFIFLLYEPLGYLSWIGIILTETKVSWTRLKALVQSLKHNTESSSQMIHNSNELKFNYQSVSFFTKLEFKRNQAYLLIGATASGKSTFLESLHYCAITNNLRSVLVPQDPYLFNQTLADNLFLNLDLTNAKRELALALLALFELDTLAANPQELLNLQVGEKGKKLSGGQVKRLHMVRSLLFDYDLVLWDDPFSAIDVITEKRVLTELTVNFNKYFMNKTLILTTHRQSTLKYFSKALFCSRDSIAIGDLNESSFKLKIDMFFKKNQNE